MSGGYAARTRAKQKAREAQDRVLALLATGVTIDEAMRQVGRQRRCYYTWCDKFEWFRDRAEAVRHRPIEEQGDFVQFRRTYFGFETPWHQQKIVDTIEGAEKGSITMILLPPGGGKTTVLEDYMNYKLGKEPNWRFCVISESQFHARKVLGHVANRMVDNALYPAYIENFGPFRAEGRELQRPWGADAIQVVQSNSGERDYSIEARGAGSSVYGASFDDIILDDIQSDKTLTHTEKLLDYFRSTLYSRIMRANSTGRIFIIGTRQGPKDFYEELLRDDVVDNLVKIPALDEHGNSYFPKKDGPLGPMGFAEEDLEKIRAVVGVEKWSRQYMQEPVSKLGQTFTERMIQDALDDSRGIEDRTRPVPGMLRIASLDPALAGHSVFRIASFDYDKLWLLDGRNVEGLARFEDHWDIIEDLTHKWAPNLWVIEGNNLQKGIARSDRIQDMGHRLGFGIVAHQTGRNKQDEIIGVASMAGAFLRQEVSIPWGTDEARHSFAPMVEQLRNWRPDIPTKLLIQDEVMALWFCYLQWQKMKSQLASRIDRRIQTRPMPWRGSDYRSLVGAR